jgi:hypothetical protein
MRGGVHLGPFSTSATNWPIVPAPGDYEDGEFGGMMISRGNWSTRRKPAPVIIIIIIIVIIITIIICLHWCWRIWSQNLFL